jgi:predicted DNA binding CopG/RHH family protein
MKKKLKTIPKFKTEAEERTFWEGHDSMEYIDWSPAKNVRFPNVKPSTQAISLRLPLSLLEKIKVEANRRDVPYQSSWIQFVSATVNDVVVSKNTSCGVR